MGPVSRWAVRRPWSAVAVWLVMAVVIGGLAARFGGSYNDSFELPDTESASAQKVLSQIPGVEDALTEATVKVVWSPESGSVTDPATQAAATALLTGMSNNPSVTCVVTPYGAPLGDGCPDPATQPGADQAQGGSAGTGQSGSATTAQPTPEQAKVLAGMGPAGMSVDGSVAYATVTFGAPVGEIPLADVSAVLEATQAANGVDGLTVGAGGQALEAAAAEPPSSRGHRRHDRPVHPAVRVRLPDRRAAARRHGPAVPGPGPGAGADHRQLLQRRHLRAHPGRDDRPGRRHRLLAVRDQPVPAGARGRSGATRGGPGVGSDRRSLRAVRRRHRDHRPERPVRDRLRVLQRPGRRRRSAPS